LIQVADPVKLHFTGGYLLIANAAPILSAPGRRANVRESSSLWANRAKIRNGKSADDRRGLPDPRRRTEAFEDDRTAGAQIIDVSKLSGTQVKFGATVSVVDEDTEEEARYQIVGDHEADVKSGRISLSSPLSRAMIGKEVGEVVEVNTPGGVKAYEILKVEWV
jgi:transcription elongation GreA/GreB family factor